MNMENYLTYLGLDKYRDLYDVPYVDEGLSETFRKWINRDFSEDVKKSILGEKSPVEKQNETVDAYGAKRNSNGEICW